MKILVTGGAGYIGSTLVMHLLHEGYQVSVFDSLKFGGESLVYLFGNSKFNLIAGDIRNKNQVTLALKDIDCVIHLAAIVGDPACRIDEKVTKEVNYLGTKILCDAAKKEKVKRLIYLSTCSNYGISKDSQQATEESLVNPISLYAKTKVKSEKYVLAQSDNNFSTCVLRLATVFGLSSRMRFDLLVNEMIKDAYMFKKIVIFQPNAWRPFVHISDVSRAIIVCLKASITDISRQIFNVTDKNYQKHDISKQIKRHIPDCKIVIVDKKDDMRDYSVSSEKIKKMLGFSTKVHLNEGIIEIITALKKGVFTEPNNYKYKNVDWPK